MSNHEVPFDLTNYGAQLESLQRDSNTRIVGSLGRMAAMLDSFGEPYPDPFIEFHNREALQITGEPAPDIDVLGTKHQNVTLAKITGSIDVDDAAFASNEVSIASEQGRWYLRSRKIGYERPIDPKLMAPVTVEIGGVRIVTVPLLTHQLLHQVREMKTKKERLAKTTMDYVVYQTARKMGYIASLGSDQTRPFDELSLWLKYPPAR